MNENVFPMIMAMTVATFNFWVMIINLPIDKKMAKFFVAANFVLGVMNLVTACKYLIM